ncbi:MAG: hypothetical protein JW715_08105 [Sedimentisphaerales bacterium]|nr:hypothetical protein [Sedimentisphaerales bacterium]
MAEKRTAYSLVELVIVVVFLGIIAAITVPKLNFSLISEQKADNVAWKIVTDIRRARSLAISSAANNTTGFALIMTGSVPYSGYEIQNLDTSATVDSHSIDSGISCTGGSRFEFGPLGNLLAGSDNQLVVSSSGKTFTIDIKAATGLTICTEN